MAWLLSVYGELVLRCALYLYICIRSIYKLSIRFNKNTKTHGSQQSQLLARLASGLADFRFPISDFPVPVASCACAYFVLDFVLCMLLYY
jgi:hypothetical protein